MAIDRRDGTDDSYPWYGELALPDICLPFSAHTPCAGFFGVAEITPADPTLPYFPLISATDNFTQYVTIRTPQ